MVEREKVNVFSPIKVAVSLSFSPPFFHSPPPWFVRVPLAIDGTWPHACLNDGIRCFGSGLKSIAYAYASTYVFAYAHGLSSLKNILPTILCWFLSTLINIESCRRMSGGCILSFFFLFSFSSIILIPETTRSDCWFPKKKQKFS